MLQAIFAAPPDTSKYMWIGYTVIFVVQAVYLLSLWVRNRNVRRDLEMLEELRGEA